MTITFFYRNPKVGYSIKKVSDLFVCMMKNKEIFEMPSQYASIKGVIKNMLFTFKHRNRTGINHITGDVHYCILPLIFCKTVLTVHDTVLYEHSKGIKRLLFKYLWYKIPLMFASKIVCISETTRQKISQFTNREDISVIGNSIDPKLVKTPYVFNSLEPRILIIGTNWNKNIVRTVKALAGIKCKIIIIGSLSFEQETILKADNIVYENKCGLSDEEIINEYKNCDIVSFCSVFEGFGMPIIEANAVGRPVITSDISPMKEVAGGSALLADPYNVDDIRCKMMCLLTEEKVRQRCIELGYENAKKYSQSNIVNQYLHIYSQLTNS